MSKALEAYQSSIVEAKALENSNELVIEKHGGSSNGSYEAIYRLHATRLKCLIAAVDRIGDERELAEIEALRLTERYWYTEVDPSVSETLLVRDRVWNVLADIVAAMAQCRLDVPYFHRSVYRHAQALLWAPILSDPQERSLGSLGTVPATRAFKLRGLNSTDAASSAAVVMGMYFCRRVHVWSLQMHCYKNRLSHCAHYNAHIFLLLTWLSTYRQPFREEKSTTVCGLDYLRAI